MRFLGIVRRVKKQPRLRSGLFFCVPACIIIRIMKNRLNLWISLAFIAILVGALGVFIYRDLNKTPIAPSAETQSNVVATTTTTAPKIDLGVVESAGDYKIEIIDSAPKVKPPKLERPIVFPPSFSSNAQFVMTGKIDEIIAILTKDQANVDAWFNLAIYRKMLNDYKGAEEIWIYLTKILKEPSYVFVNLGDLYGYYLRDSAKAEINFLRAVEVSPRWLVGYERVVDFYVTVLNDKAKAKSFLEASIVKYPDIKSQLEPLIAELKLK